MTNLHSYSISKFSMEKYDSTSKTKTWKHFSQTNANARYKLMLAIGKDYIVFQITEVSKTNEICFNLKVFIERSSLGIRFVDPSNLRIIVKPPVLALRYNVIDNQTSEMVLSKAQFSIPDDNKFREAIELLNQVGISLKDTKSNFFVLREENKTNSSFFSNNKENFILESQILDPYMHEHNTPAAIKPFINNQNQHDSNGKYYEELIYGYNNNRKRNQHCINEKISAFSDNWNSQSRYTDHNQSNKVPEMHAGNQVNKNINFQHSQIHDRSQNLQSKLYLPNYQQTTSSQNYCYNNASQKILEKANVYEQNYNSDSKYYDLKSMFEINKTHQQNFLINNEPNVDPPTCAGNDYSNHSQLFYNNNHVNPIYNELASLVNAEKKKSLYDKNTESQLINKDNFECLIKSVLKKVLPEISKSEISADIDFKIDTFSTKQNNNNNSLLHLGKKQTKNKQKKKSEQPSTKVGNKKKISKKGTLRKTSKKGVHEDYNKNVLSANFFLTLDIQTKFEVLKKLSFIEAVAMLQECETDTKIKLNEMINRYTKSNNKNIYSFFEKPQSKPKKRDYKKAHLLIKKIMKLTKDLKENQGQPKNIINQDQDYHNQSEKILKNCTAVDLKKQIKKKTNNHKYDPVKDLEMWNPPQQQDENCRIVGEKRLRKTKKMSYKAADNLFLASKQTKTISFSEKQDDLCSCSKSIEDEISFKEPFRKNSSLEVDNHITTFNKNLLNSFNPQVFSSEQANITMETLLPLEELKQDHTNQVSGRDDIISQSKEIIHDSKNFQLVRWTPTENFNYTKR